MNRIKLCDVTMEQADKHFSLSFREKIELAKLLDGLGVDVITLEGLGSSKTDALRVKSVAMAVKNSTVAVPVQLSAEGVDAAWSALQSAKHPRLQVCAPVSSVQMEYLHHKKPAQMHQDICTALRSCRALCADVEFIAGDATRSEPEFLHSVLAAAIDAGATTVTVCDTAGSLLPEEFGCFVGQLYEAVPGLKNVTLGVSCANTLGLAEACAIAAVCRGAGEIKAAAYPQSTAALAGVAQIISRRSDAVRSDCNLKMAQLNRTVEQIAWMCRTERKSTSPFDNGVRTDDGIFLTAHDTQDSVLSAVAQLGYDLSDEDKPRVFEAFQAIASKKDSVSIRELDAIVASAAMQVPSAYQLDTYVINSGNTIASTAHVQLRRGQQVLRGICVGDGPIDAAFLAIEQITGRHYELDDFQLAAVTEGREAMGQTIVRLRAHGKLYAGRGISTDIVCAGINAYLSALNKIVYEEEDA